MRKDVKFGMTIGAILVVTLVVYIIVLYRGGTAPNNHSEKVAIVTPPADGDAAPHPGDSTGAATPTHADADTAAPADNSTPNSVTPSAPTDAASPATQPSPASSSGAADAWDAALNHGVVKMLAADATAHTLTPTIDHTDSAPIRGDIVAQDGRAPLVDMPATTQPSGGIALPAPGPAGQRTHVVRSGENLWTISAAVYGNSKYWKKIIAANPGLDPKNLRVGKTLIIPELADVEKAQPADSSFAAVAADPNTTYKVVSGDSLERIAIRLYGSAQMKDTLYEANKSLIGPDEDRLKVGWILKLPQPPTVSAAASR
jgi:nucleoid-associated protein YgaU